MKRPAYMILIHVAYIIGNIESIQDFRDTQYIWDMQYIWGIRYKRNESDYYNLIFFE